MGNSIPFPAICDPPVKALVYEQYLFLRSPDECQMYVGDYRSYYSTIIFMFCKQNGLPGYN